MAGRFLTSAAGGGIMGFLTKGIGSKLIFYVVVIFAWTQLIAFVIEQLPALGLDTLFQGLPGAFLWGLNFMDAPFVLGAIMAAEMSAFAVRLRKG